MNTTLLIQVEDEYGPILIYDDGECRQLAFAEQDSQSRMLKASPHILQYEYTQAMLLVLLFCQPKRVLLLGLGGGSLLTTLHHLIPGIQLTAIELRQQVIDLANQYFRLPRGKRISVQCDDAARYLSSSTDRKVDIIFTDLYHASAADPSQLQAEFIQHCAQRLKNDGWLVINGWNEHRENSVFLQALRTEFSDIRTVLTGSKNWVLLAGKVADTQNANQLKEQACQWSNQLGYPLARHLARLKTLGD